MGRRLDHASRHTSQTGQERNRYRAAAPLHLGGTHPARGRADGPRSLGSSPGLPQCAQTSPARSLAATYRRYPPSRLRRGRHHVTWAVLDTGIAPITRISAMEPTRNSPLKFSIASSRAAARSDPRKRSSPYRRQRPRYARCGDRRRRIPTRRWEAKIRRHGTASKVRLQGARRPRLRQRLLDHQGARHYLRERTSAGSARHPRRQPQPRRRFDPSVFGCGHTPLCKELRRLWRQGWSSDCRRKRGLSRLQHARRRAQANIDLSIGDPANLDEAIAVGSVHKTNPHTYGMSYFSSRGPTADGRLKPDWSRPASASSRPATTGRATQGETAPKTSTWR